jgi:hypothetical protein
MTLNLGPAGIWASSRLWAAAGDTLAEAAAELDELGYGALWLGSSSGAVPSGCPARSGASWPRRSPRCDAEPRLRAEVHDRPAWPPDAHPPIEWVRGSRRPAVADEPSPAHGGAPCANSIPSTRSC